ncbi:MAG: peptidoglycan-binding domain-containing protein [Terriglobia bacterium]|jgi:hypothetical protein
MTSPRQRSKRHVALAVGVLFVAAGLTARAQQNAATTKSHHTAKTAKHSTGKKAPAIAHRTSTAKAGAHTSTAGKKWSARSARGKKRAVPSSSRARLAMLHLQPDRIEEIQQALIGVGYLTTPATGKWDDPTRDAMRRYQTDNGFPATGLPDAKSLMKLGLGPHPLPAELQPTAAQNTATPSAKTNPN